MTGKKTANTYTEAGEVNQNTPLGPSPKEFKYELFFVVILLFCLRFHICKTSEQKLVVDVYRKVLIIVA